MKTAEDRAERSRQRMLEGARQYQLGTYSARFVAPVFQQMIRAEAAAQPSGLCVVIVDGEVSQSLREVGFCACVTCGKILPWKGGVDRYSGMHTGHFLASRRNSILFEEDNVAPSCSHCNFFLGGNPQAFRKWMEAVRPEAIARLESLKATVRTFTREELVDMRIAYAARLKLAEARMVHGA